MRLLLFFTILTPLLLSAQVVRNVRLYPESGEVMVVYDLKPGLAGSRYQASLYYSTNGGNSFRLAEKVSGAIGSIRPNTDLQIIWRAQSELGTILIEEFQAEVRVSHKTAPVLKDLPAMIRIGGGSFQMGSNEGEDDEKPIHTVRINSFEMGKYEVTVGEFAAFVAATQYQTTAEKKGGSYIWDGSQWELKAGINWRHDIAGNLHPKSADSHPVIHVSWDDAQAYCRWLSQETGQNYRLPTEAEWEYAARGGTRSRGYLYGGSNQLEEVGWYYLNSGSKTHPVGKKSPNELGLYDMSGNVWEWCQDRWHLNYEGAPTDGSAWEEGSSSRRVLRGGSWGNIPADLRVSYRDHRDPGSRHSNVGFRLARTL